MYGMVLGGAWLLSVSETAIEVLHHPSETFEFDSVVKLVQRLSLIHMTLPTKRIV